MEERKTKGPTPEEKKAAVAARRKITNQNYNNRHREAVNAYANNFMKEKYRTDEAYRLREIERGKLKYRRVVEQRRLDALAKEAATATTEKSND
jgi:PhoPQ-activated pathogenicity-related protein